MFFSLSLDCGKYDAVQARSLKSNLIDTFFLQWHSMVQWVSFVTFFLEILIEHEVKVKLDKSDTGKMNDFVKREFR